MPDAHRYLRIAGWFAGIWMMKDLSRDWERERSKLQLGAHRDVESSNIRGGACIYPRSQPVVFHEFARVESVVRRNEGKEVERMCVRFHEC
jgi:hypothetical protein